MSNKDVVKYDIIYKFMSLKEDSTAEKMNERKMQRIFMPHFRQIENKVLNAVMVRVINQAINRTIRNNRKLRNFRSQKKQQHNG